MEDITPVKLGYYIAEPMFDANETLCPLIFMHGFAQSKEVWGDIPQIAADETKRKAFVIDLRNIGDSGWSEDLSQEAMAKDLFHFMNLKKINKAGLIAHSLGGAVCQKFVMEWPDRVEFLIVEDLFQSKNASLTYVAEMGLSFYRHWVEAVRSIPPYMNKTDAIKYAVDHLYYQLPPEKLNLISGREKLCQIDYNLKQMDDGTYDLKDNVDLFFNIRRELLELPPVTGIYDGPIYFIISPNSWCKVYEHTDEILETFPKAQFFCIEGTTHNIHIDAPEKFMNIMLECILKHQCID